ncbi:MAG: hypothetical protein KBD27_02885 [Candidatus Moranbacteria bacterium]|nr:hypothetical protein [Candidatus Moranbacteria bacterium]
MMEAHGETKVSSIVVHHWIMQEAELFDAIEAKHVESDAHIVNHSVALHGEGKAKISPRWQDRQWFEELPREPTIAHPKTHSLGEVVYPGGLFAVLVAVLVVPLTEGKSWERMVCLVSKFLKPLGLTDPFPVSARQ